MLHEDILNPEALDLYRANRNRYSRFRLYEVRPAGRSARPPRCGPPWRGPLGPLG